MKRNIQKGFLILACAFTAAMLYIGVRPCNKFDSRLVETFKRDRSVTCLQAAVFTIHYSDALMKYPLHNRESHVRLRIFDHLFSGNVFRIVDTSIPYTYQRLVKIATRCLRPTEPYSFELLDPPKSC